MISIIVYILLLVSSVLEFIYCIDCNTYIGIASVIVFALSSLCALIVNIVNKNRNNINKILSGITVVIAFIIFIPFFRIYWTLFPYTFPIICILLGALIIYLVSFAFAFE